MSSRMDKYKELNKEEVPKRSDKNKQLYKQIYNAYDEFENLIVPSNAREIDLSELKKEVTNRDEYRKLKDINDITNTNNNVLRKEKMMEQAKQEQEIYDINELLNKAVTENKKPELIEPTLANGDYLKKLNLDSNKTNIEQVKEMYDEIQEESNETDPALLKTANLSLEILTDLKSDDDTMVSPPIKNEELPDGEEDFYSSKYKFSKKDFEDRNVKGNINDDNELYVEDGNGKFFFKILLLIFGILLVVIILVYLFNYFNRV